MIKEQSFMFWDLYFYRIKFRALIRLGFHFRSGEELKPGEFQTERVGRNYLIRWHIPVDNTNQLKLNLT